MSPLKYLIPLLCLAGLPGFARLGESAQECMARYGPNIQVLQQGTKHAFMKGGYIIVVGLHDGRCDSLGYQHADAGAAGLPSELTEKEMTTLLTANAGPSTWKSEAFNEPGKFWTRADGLARASYDPKMRTLTLVTQAYLDRIDRQAAK